MPVVWTLKHKLAVGYGIFSAEQLQALIREKTGEVVSLKELELLMRNTPPAILHFSIIQAVCNALNCELSDYFLIGPDHTDPSPDTA